MEKYIHLDNTGLMIDRNDLLRVVGSICEQVDNKDQLSKIAQMAIQRRTALVEADPYVYCIKRIWKGKAQWRFLSPHVGSGMSYDFNHPFLHVMTSRKYAEEVALLGNRRYHSDNMFKVVKIAKEKLPQRYLDTQRQKKAREGRIRDLITPGRTIKEIMTDLIAHGYGTAYRWDILKLLPEHLTINASKDRIELKREPV